MLIILDILLIEIMKDGFIQALEILEVVKKILKIKKEIMMMIIIFFI